MVSRRIYWVACIALPLFSLLFMATIFGNGRMEGIPVGVVDADNTSASRSLIRRVEASPALHVVRHYADEAEAREDVRRKKIYGYMGIPSDFETRLVSGREVTVSYYYQYAFLSVGGEVRATFERLLKGFSVTPIVTEAIALGVDEGAISTFLMPVTSQDHALYNPTRDYAVYLSQPFFFVLLQVLLLLVTVYTLGSGGRGGNLFARLLPYSLIFFLMGMLANFVFFGVMRMPLPCGWLPLNLLTLLFILATQALGVTIAFLSPSLGVGMSAASMIGSLGATLSGVTFPISSMYAPVRVASVFFPVHHFVEGVHSLVYQGGGYADVWMQVVCLMLFLLPPMLLMYKRI